MEFEKIIRELNQRFAEPLPEFYKRRLVFWHDEEREFADRLDEITLDGAKIVALNGSNNFTVKKLLAHDDPYSNYLVYCPTAYEISEENWLLDMELYSEQFRADLVSIWMEELSAPDTPALRLSFKRYRKFLNARTRRDKIAAQRVTPATPAQLQAAIMAAIAGLKDAKPGAIIRAALAAGLQADSNSVWREFVNYGVDEAFWRMAAQGTGYEDENPGLGQFAAHLLLTAATRTLREKKFLYDFRALISSAHQSWCYDLVSDWLRGWDNGSLYQIARDVEEELGLPERFMNLQAADLLETEVFPCVHEVILEKLMTDIRDNEIDADAITNIVEKRRACAWYDGVRNYYDGVLQVANMRAFQKKHSAGFHTTEPAKLWKEYVTEYYLMDTYYREFHKSYSESLKTYHQRLSDLFAHVMERAEGLYKNWFLNQLGSAWTNASADSLREYGYVPGVERQTDFYRREVASADSRVYVIISDAMRYEVATSLAERLRRDTQAKVELKSMQAVFPTITKFGMAALLPHKALSVEMKSGKTERLAVLADGQSTEANNRDKVLKAADSASVALKYRDIIGMKRVERQALVKGMNVVYIYHDTIDEAGHQETSVFSACDAAIEELKNMVRVITNEWSGVNIVITADHGFLYTYSPLTEDDKVDKATEKSEDIELGRRYAIMRKGAQSQYLLPVKFLDGNTNYDAFAPRENIRIKMNGGGLNFVHGGVSLQEMATPVIEYHFLRNQSKEYQKNRDKYDTKPVEIVLLSASRKISNMSFFLDFYQKDAIGDNRKAAIYQILFTDSDGNPVSDTVKIIADKSDGNERNRVFRCKFNLKARKYSNTETYCLVITDGNGLQRREEFQIDIASAGDEFDFFG